MGGGVEHRRVNHDTVITLAELVDPLSHLVMLLVREGEVAHYGVHLASHLDVLLEDAWEVLDFGLKKGSYLAVLQVEIELPHRNLLRRLVLHQGLWDLVTLDEPPATPLLVLDFDPDTLQLVLVENKPRWSRLLVLTTNTLQGQTYIDDFISALLFKYFESPYRRMASAIYQGLIYVDWLLPNGTTW